MRLPETFLYEPIDVPKAIGRDAWVVDGPVVHMAMYGLRIPFPTRMTIFRLGSGDLFLHSPTAWSAALGAAVGALGRVRHLVSPNRIHYAGIPGWAAAFPDALTWASPRVRERAASQRIEVRFTHDLADAPDVAWAGEIDQQRVAGRFLDEVVFFHRASRTLVLADLIENFEADRVPARWRWLLRLSGAVHPDGKAPVDLRATFSGHHEGVRAAVRRMIAWEPDRIIVGHGRSYEGDTAAELRRAFRWAGPI